MNHMYTPEESWVVEKRPCTYRLTFECSKLHQMGEGRSAYMSSVLVGGVKVPYHFDQFGSNT